MARYAENTKVSVDSSRGEITSILAKNGVQNMGWSSTPTKDQLIFQLQGGTYRLTMVRPSAASMEQRDRHLYVYPHNVDWESKVDQEWRRVWRANVLLLKAKLEFIDSGDTTIERELLPYRVLDSGQTVEEAMLDGGLPMLTAGA